MAILERRSNSVKPPSGEPQPFDRIVQGMQHALASDNVRSGGKLSYELSVEDLTAFQREYNVTVPGTRLNGTTLIEEIEHLPSEGSESEPRLRIAGYAALSSFPEVSFRAEGVNRRGEFKVVRHQLRVPGGRAAKFIFDRALDPVIGSVDGLAKAAINERIDGKVENIRLSNFPDSAVVVDLRKPFRSTYRR